MLTRQLACLPLLLLLLLLLPAGRCSCSTGCTAPAIARNVKRFFGGCLSAVLDTVACKGIRV
jgi:hypothetical protein